ncbi:MAG: acetoin utilization protein AcuC [Tetrasphaera sp.]
MVAQARLVWDPSFTAYNFGPGHPMNPIRLDLTARLCAEYGLFDHVEAINPDVADDDLLATVHDRDYIAKVKAASDNPRNADESAGLGTEDDPAFHGMHEAAARIVAGTVEVCRQVHQGEIAHGVNFCGGMHHSMPDRASGFCIYNDIAVGIQWLLDAGVERVAYIDLDVHHGDGVEKIFETEPRVLTCSIHENGRVLFPGTGWPRDVGVGPGLGSVLNVAMPPGARDSAWLRAVRAGILPVVRAFRPQVLVTQHGCDTHAQDPLAHMMLSIDAQRDAMTMVHELAHDICDGRWVALGGGGYELVNVVPRSWTHLSAIAAHQPIAVTEPLPQSWRDHVETTFGRGTPDRMGDLDPAEGGIWVQPWEMGYNPHSEVDRAIMATREAVFGFFGLDVWYD